MPEQGPHEGDVLIAKREQDGHFEISSLAARGLLARIGLEPGDTILTLDGDPMPGADRLGSKAMDLFDLTDASRGRPAVERILCPTLVIGVTSDILFPVWQQRELADALRKQGAAVTYVELDAPYGHDTFLIDRERVGGAIKAHLEEVE